MRYYPGANRGGDDVSFVAWRGVTAAALLLTVLSGADVAQAATDTETRLLEIIGKLEARIARLEAQSATDRQKRNVAPAEQPAADRPAQPGTALAAAVASQAQARSQTANVALPAVQQTPRWDGPVFGVSVGFAQLKSRFRSEGTTAIVPPFPPEVRVSRADAITDDRRGALANAFIGYDVLLPHSFLAGLQVDATLGSVRATQLGTLGTYQASGGGGAPFFPGTRNDFSTYTQLDWATSILVKLGYLVNAENLVYGVTGYTHAMFTNDLLKQKFAADGLTVGLGWEYRLAQNWSVRTEYRQTRFAETTFAATNVAATALGGGGFDVATTALQTKQTSELQSLTVGLSYRP